MSDPRTYRYLATVLGVHDGDTLHADVRLGCDVSARLTIRFAGLNAPELNTPEGVQAKQFVLDWLAVNAPDSVIELETVKDRREKYGRYLGTISANGRNLNADLLASNNAVLYMV